MCSVSKLIWVSIAALKIFKIIVIKWTASIARNLAQQWIRNHVYFNDDERQAGDWIYSSSRHIEEPVYDKQAALYLKAALYILVVGKSLCGGCSNNGSCNSLEWSYNTFVNKSCRQWRMQKIPEGGQLSSQSCDVTNQL